MKTKEIFSRVDELYFEITREWNTSKESNYHSPHWQVFTSPVICYLFIMQRLSGKSSLAGALSYLKESAVGGAVDKLLGGSKRLAYETISSATGGLTKARKRIDLDDIKSLFEHVNNNLSKVSKGGNKSKPKRNWYLLDGTTIGLRRTKEILKDFPAGNESTYSAPYARIVLAHNLQDGLSELPAIGNIIDSEQKLSYTVMDALPEGSGIIGDRNFGVFSVAHHAQKCGLKILVRLSKDRAERIVGKKSIRDGKYTINWTPSQRELQAHPSIPKSASVVGTLVVATIERNGYKNEQFFFFTNDQLSAQNIIDLYAKRWFIENDIRTLKSTLNLDMVYSTTPKTAIKEILFAVMAYNFVRALIAKGASKINLQPRDISFTRAIDVIRITSTRLIHANTPIQVEYEIQSFYRNIKQIRHPNRSKIRSEPRVVKFFRRSRFPAANIMSKRVDELS